MWEQIKIMTIDFSFFFTNLSQSCQISKLYLKSIVSRINRNLRATIWPTHFLHRVYALVLMSCSAGVIYLVYIHALYFLLPTFITTVLLHSHLLYMESFSR